ncbi:TPA: carbohydrate kinase [Escherichia coli]|nr:putative carbohydrate kinase; bacteriophage origin [Escherichia coli PCN061]EEW2440165.1 carbohydrate kinase [Escherichia coli]EEW2584580.1 carbohydrate kinase [Escherichia coli]EFD1685067.1 carbohydrate kinase [Escherichia coli]EFD7786105.1 carbohydrate kinase [Escherichia coli]
MHRIDTKTAQKDKFGAGKNGFTRGNPQTGTPATDLDDDYFDMLQEELCSVVEASGASLEKGRHDQLLTALRALLLSRKNPFGDIKSDGTVKTALQNLGLGDTSGYVGRWVNTRVFTSSGTYTPTPGTKRIRVTITGGGGGGGGCQAISNNETFFGAGGGAGGTIISIITPTQNSYPVTIGAGGAGGVSATNGTSGGNSVFASLIAPGGAGGGKVGVTNTNGGNGGVPSTGDIRITGGNGGDGQSGNISVSGEGGTSYWGGGGRAGAGGGVSGKAYGSGGGGAYDAGYSGTSMKGGKGAAGICIIEEFA